MANKPKEVVRPSPKGLGSWRVEYDVDDNPASMFVTLFDDGTVKSAVRASQKLKGHWKIQEGELSMNIQQPHSLGCIDHELRCVGALKRWSTKIAGSIIEGEMDSCVVGNFIMTPVIASMTTDLRTMAEEADKLETLLKTPVYPKAKVAGSWLLVWDALYGHIFYLDLREDGSFKSTRGMGNGWLGGRWGMWDQDRFYLTAVRMKSSGVQMTGDIMYWGNIQGEAGEPTKIEGSVWYGYVEPTNLGPFTMKRVQSAPAVCDDDGEGGD